MNEQLTVKNFGPFQKEEVKVIFRRISVFIGPSGGGKSTLAKLAAIFWDKSYSFLNNIEEQEKKFLLDYSLEKYYGDNSQVTFSIDKETAAYIDFSDLYVTGMSGISNIDSGKIRLAEATALLKKAQNAIAKAEKISSEQKAINLVKKAEEFYTEGRKIIELTLADAKSNFYKRIASFFPANRIIIPSVEYSWPGFLRDDIGLPKEVLNFANFFSISRKEISELDIPFMNVRYMHQNGQDFIKIPGVETLFRLYETASGIQSVTPLLVLLEHLSRNTEQAQSFIIEEPELNLYPTAQQGLLNWLVEKCTKGDNDLTITTHSPYILSHLNLLLYAYQVAHDHPDRADEVAEVVPRASWINPKEFACYQVENGGVTSLVSEDLGLIDDNGLDGLSGDAADAFDNLIRLSKAVARK